MHYTILVYETQSQLAARTDPRYVRLHNPRTLIIADEAPMLDFLQNEGNFTLQSLKGAAPSPDAIPAPAPMPVARMPSSQRFISPRRRRSC